MKEEEARVVALQVVICKMAIALEEAKKALTEAGVGTWFIDVELLRAREAATLFRVTVPEGEA